MNATMNNTYPCKGWQKPVNNIAAWAVFKSMGYYTPANDNPPNQRRTK